MTDAGIGTQLSLEEIEEDWWKVHESNGRDMEGFASRQIVTAADYFEEVCDARMDFPALSAVDCEESFTYRELDAFSNQVSHWAIALQSKNIGLHCTNRPSFIGLWMGCSKAAQTVACINTNLKERFLGHATLLAQTQHFIVSSDLLESWASVDFSLDASHDTSAWHLWVFCGENSTDLPSWNAIEQSLGEFAERFQLHNLNDTLSCMSTERLDKSVRIHITPSDPCFYIYTSGTTGRSKAAIFNHRRFIGAGVTWARHMQLSENDRYYISLPLYHGNGGVVAVSAAIRSGCSMIIRKKFSARNFFSDIRNHDCTATVYIGELWRYVISLAPSDDDSNNPLRVAAGNGLTAEIWRHVVERYGIERIVEHYGQTEMPAAHPMINSYGREGSCGFIPNQVRGNLGTEKLVKYDVERGQLYRKEDGFCQECEVGEPGEAIVKLTGEYGGYTSGEATNSVLYHNVFEQGDIWYHSGDLLMVDEKGFFFFIDRAGDSFRWKGENVSTSEVAQDLIKSRILKEVNIYGVLVPHCSGKAGMASVLLRDDIETAEALRMLQEYLPHALPTYAQPRFWRMRSQENDVTGTLKLQKFKYISEGFNPAQILDQLFLYDPMSGFQELTETVYQRIKQGDIRL